PGRVSVSRFDMHPLAMPSFQGVNVDGCPARLVASDDPTRVRFLPGIGGLDVEFVAAAVPALGCRRYMLEPAEVSGDEVDDGCEIAAGDVRVTAGAGGTWSIMLGDRTYGGLFGIEDAIDRGASSDCDPE